MGSASSEYLRGALENPCLTETDVVLILRNRFAGTAALRAIAEDRRWSHDARIRRGIVFHPRVPAELGRRLLDHLGAAELLDLTNRPHARPELRIAAERAFAARFSTLTAGERIAAARKVPRGVFEQIFDTDDPRVLRALLANPRLTEIDVVRVIRSRTADRELLTEIAADERWAGLRSIRMAAVSEPRTPVPVALSIVARLSAPDLLRLTRDERSPQIVRVAASRRLGAAAAP